MAAEVDGLCADANLGAEAVFVPALAGLGAPFWRPDARGGWVGLSLSTKLSPEAMPVLMISLYYLAVALGTALSGSLAGFYSADSEAVYFGTLGAITIGIGVITLALRNITADWGRAAHDWKAAMNQFAILYEDRFTQAAHGSSK
mgnify:CR=1 FL=1